MPGIFKIIIGAIILGVGLYITFGMQSNTIAYGAIAVGGFQLLFGLIEAGAHIFSSKEAKANAQLQKHVENTAEDREKVNEILRKLKGDQ